MDELNHLYAAVGVNDNRTNKFYKKNLLEDVS